MVSGSGETHAPWPVPFQDIFLQDLMRFAAIDEA